MDLEKLIIVMQTKVSNLLLTVEKVLHINVPTFFEEIPNAIQLRNAVKGKGALITTKIQKDSLAVQWNYIMSTAKFLTQDMTKMYEMSEAWNSNTRKKFLNKNDFQYKADRERKVEFNRLLLEWINLGRVTEYEIEILRGVMEVHAAQRVPQQTTGTHRNPPAHQPTQWKYPGFNPLQLSNNPNPTKFKTWRKEFDIWSRAGGNYLEIGQGNAWLRRAIDPELLTKLEEKLNCNNEVNENIQEIEKFIQQTHPRSKMRQEVHSMVNHTSDMVFADLVLDTTRAAKECEFTNQSGTSILTGMMISYYQNVEMNKWISDNIMQLTNMISTQDFEQAIRNSHNVMLLNKGLPSYDGKGQGQSKSNLNNMTTSTQQEKKEAWLKTQPCFDCGEGGHTAKECKKTNISQCKMKGCKIKHTRKAHQNMKSYFEKKKKERNSNFRDKKSGINEVETTTETEGPGNTKTEVKQEEITKEMVK